MKAEEFLKKKNNVSGRQYMDDWSANDVVEIMEEYAGAKAGQHETIVMWNFTKIEVPKSGDYVWVCNARDKNSKLIKWGTGDEAFYSYWMPADRPKPPQAT